MPPPITTLLTPSKDPFDSIRNYAAAVMQKETPPAAIPNSVIPTSFFDGIKATRRIVQPKAIREEDGTAMVSFTSDEIRALAAPFAYTLIGKFSGDIPLISELAPALKAHNFKGKFTVSFMDMRHVEIGRAHV